MSETTTINIGGAELTVETSALFRAWFEKHLGKIEAPLCTFPTPRPGERYIGSIINPNGSVRHIFLLPGDEKKSWKDGMEWAQGIGGDLPDRIEQAMLFAHTPEEFQQEAYWSNTQHAGFSSNAWYQYFNYGNQSYYYESAELRVRAVRREFSDSVI